MATTKIIVRESKINRQGKCVVYVQYCHDEKTALFSTNVKVPPLYFDYKNGRVRKGLTGYTSMNSLISKKEGEVIKAYTDLLLKDEEPVIDKVRQSIKGEGKKEQEDTRFITLFSEFLDKKKLDPDIRKSTTKHFSVTLGKVKSFLESEGISNITIDRVNFETLESFNSYLLETLAPGSANNHLKRVKLFLKKAYFNGKYNTQDFRNVGLNKDKVRDQKKIFLNKEELDILYKKDMSSERLEKVKDLFILACCTGLRFSDLLSLRKEHIKKDGITITTKKTDTPLDIPLFLYSKEIIEKYNGNFPRITNQKMNDYVKEVCKIAEIDEKIIIPVWRGKDRKDDVFSKHELVSTHTGRKSFVMLCVTAGMEIERLASITGNDSKTLKHYYEIAKSEKSRAIEEVEKFYNKDLQA